MKPSSVNVHIQGICRKNRLGNLGNYSSENHIETLRVFVDVK